MPRIIYTSFVFVPHYAVVGVPYPNRNILLLFLLLVGRRVAVNGGVLARLELRVGWEDLLGLVYKECVSRCIFE